MKVESVNEEANDAQEPVQRGTDHQGSAGAGGRARTDEVFRRYGISTTTFYKWKARYGGLEVSEARRQRAKMWELRAAVSLARLWRDQGKRVGARDLLAPVYDWFTDGFETADLRDAKALLDELA